MIIDNRTWNMERGAFTIVELIVAISLFSILIATVAGIFISSLRNQGVSISLVEAQDNVSLALEQMAREVRTGITFTGSADFSRLSFYNVWGTILIAYQYDAVSQRIERCENLNCNPITPSTIAIKDFTIQYNLVGGKVPVITVNFSVASKDPRLQNIMQAYRVQTSLSAINY